MLRTSQWSRSVRARRGVGDGFVALSCRQKLFREACQVLVAPDLNQNARARGPLHLRTFRRHAYMEPCARPDTGAGIGCLVLIMISPLSATAYARYLCGGTRRLCLAFSRYR